MAHQCLQCGESFPDGSPELLKGCPKCEGTRFFYTQAPLQEQERAELMAQTNKDLRGILEDLVKGPARPNYEDPVWSLDAREKWLRVDAGKLRAHEPGAVREVPAPAAVPAAPGRAAEPPRRAPAEQATLPLAQNPPRPTSTTPALDDSQPREAKPEVVVVDEPGKYRIDVEQLLEKSPIVVRRDGVYVVHLPSVFAGNAKR